MASLTINAGQQQLFTAAALGDTETIRVLHGQEGINNKAANDEGDTVLHIAARNGHLVATQILGELGAKFHLMNNDGQTPFDVATDPAIAESLKPEKVREVEERIDAFTTLFTQCELADYPHMIATLRGNAIELMDLFANLEREEVPRITNFNQMQIKIRLSNNYFLNAFHALVDTCIQSGSPHLKGFSNFILAADLLKEDSITKDAIILETFDQAVKYNKSDVAQSVLQYTSEFYTWNSMLNRATSEKSLEFTEMLILARARNLRLDPAGRIENLFEHANLSADSRGIVEAAIQNIRGKRALVFAWKKSTGPLKSIPEELLPSVVQSRSRNPSQHTGHQ